MRNIKKILALLLVLTIATAALPMAVFAGAQHQMTVTLRIEGIAQNYYYDTLTIQYSSANLTVQDLIIYADNNSDAITVVGATGSTPYITDINGDVAGAFGGWDGWLFTINGVEAATGINGTYLNEGDEVLFYYGDPYGVGMQYPEVDLSEINKRVIKFTSKDTTYDLSYNPIVSVNPVEGATVYFEGTEYVTDDEGKITVQRDLLSEGVHAIQIEKKAENGLPLVLRFAPDFTVDIPKITRIPGDMDDDGEITVSDALAVLRIAAKLAPATYDVIAVCDMDKDGEITVSDALAVLRIAAKLA